MLAALGCSGAYVLLVGLASFAEQRVARDLDIFTLAALLRLDAAALALGAVLLLAPGRGFPGLVVVLVGLGIGLIAGLGSLFFGLTLDDLPG
jgi:hypothetical protein